MADLLGNSLSATHSLPRLAEDGPIQTESSPVPAGHRVRGDQMEALFPAGPESAKGNPKEPIKQTNSWFRVPAFQDNKLLAKSEVSNIKFWRVRREQRTAPNQIRKRSSIVAKL